MSCISTKGRKAVRRQGGKAVSKATGRRLGSPGSGEGWAFRWPPYGARVPSNGRWATESVPLIR